MINWRKGICSALLITAMIFTACGNADIAGAEDFMAEENAGGPAEPHTKENGEKYRLAYVDYDEYMPASRQFGYILQGLEEYGWIREGSLPFTQEDIDRDELSTKQMYDMLVKTDLGDYIEFAEDAFYYLGYEDEEVIAGELKKRAGEDFDLVITFGTSAGVLVSSLDLPVPMTDFSATDPVASGIIESSTEGSGKPNVWAQVEPKVPQRQLKYYYSLKPFERLGVIVYGDEVISGIPDVEAAAKEIGFEIVKYNIEEQPRETGEELDAYYKMVKGKFEQMAEEDIDAFLFPPDLVNDQEYLKEMFEPLYRRKIPVYCMDDVATVYNGAMMIISATDFENVGRFVADAITKILSGAEAGSLPCIYTSAPYICVNLDVIRRIDYPQDFEFLAICDEIYSEDR
ncbi:MAG: hypothetical protein IJ796_01760 [Lachnospiraceae bacterium]|nr:hypothetical protein [Lachnospiraceae bacterium]